MIWPFVSGKTPASRQCATWRSRHGRWETSSARYPSLTARTAGRERGAYRHAPLCEITRGDVRIDAGRQERAPLRTGSETARLAREHDMPLWRAYGAFLQGLATA